MINAPGIYDMPFSEYLADPCPQPSLSASVAHTLLTLSAQHAWQEHPRLGNVAGEEANEADIGSTAHELLLGGEDRIVALEFDDWRTKAARAAREEVRASGHIPLLAYQLPAVQAMVDKALNFVEMSELAGIFERGQSERTLIWKEGNVWCRARPDFLTNDHGVLLHYKTTRAVARAEKFIRGIMQNSGYGLAMRFYARGLSQVFQPGNHLNTKHVILVQEQAPPYACSLIGLTPAKAAIEDERVRDAIFRWTACLASKQWPAYDTRIHYAEPTAWEMLGTENEEHSDE